MTADTTPPKSAEQPLELRDVATEMIVLDPRCVQLRRSGIPGDIVVRATISDPVIGGDRCWRSIRIARAFPLSMPNRYIGMRDSEDHDIGILETLDGLDSESRTIVDDELERRYFVPRILRVIDVREEPGVITWDVETDKGRRTFYVQNLRESVQPIVPGKRILLIDKDGVRFEIPDLQALDAKSEAVLSRVA